MKIYDKTDLENAKKFIRLYEDNKKIKENVWEWNISGMYKFFIKNCHKIIQLEGRNAVQNSSYDYFSFSLETEIVDLLYEKYKPIVEEYECILKKRKLKDLKNSLESTKKEIKKVEENLCK